MDAVGLPILTPNVEYSTIPPIETNRILNYFNQFVTSTVHILNKFAVICESKLVNLDFRLQDVEATLTILEEKLASIPSSETSEPVNMPASLPNVAELAPTPPPPPPPLPTMQHQEPDLTSPHQKASEVAASSEIARFAKMLAVGVPLLAVEQKMRSEGYDPALLNTFLNSIHSSQRADPSSSDVTLDDTDHSGE